MIYPCSFALTLRIPHEQVELARKYEGLELFKNDAHPQFSLIKVRNGKVPLFSSPSHPVAY